ncbi:MAG: hypothetical protein LBD07_04695 [Spirochaetaceae bacterium]|jgi:Flp pilus assembly protein TadD|nr:hypothetical protein [Spirochaetaceae bacterium]
MQKQSGYNSTPAAVIVRSAALFGVIFQYNLIADELTSTSVFISTTVCAFFAGYALYFNKTKPLHAVITLLLAPFAARMLLALPRLFTAGNLQANIALDSLLLNYDRNNFVLCIPFYYAAITTFFSSLSRRVLRTMTLLDCVIIAVTFSITRSAEIKFYNLSIVPISVFGLLLFLELLAMVISIPKEISIKKKETASAFALLICFMLVSGAILISQSGKGKADNTSAGNKTTDMAGGKGLIRPEVFNFDMTPFLNLNTEVSLGNDLIFIVRKNKNDNHIFMRRFVLSAYNSVKTNDADAGFTRNDIVDEKNQRMEIPVGESSWVIPRYKKRSNLEQEYYIKNIDGSAFLAMNEPVSVIPYKNYDSSSFKSVYAVKSMITDADMPDLYKVSLAYKNDPCFGMTPEEFLWYTAYANSKNGITPTEEKIQQLAERITASCNDNFSKVLTLLGFLTFGEYRYSLKPGIASDGDQLNYFLFESRRGYCSYFAMSFASMLRSLQIPSRVVVGFYLDPLTERLGFYPVRSANAHAWVEVFFPEYGWIEFDPTTQILAEDELDPGTEGASYDNFEQLMKEILENRSKLEAKSKAEEQQENTFLKIIHSTVEKVRSLLFPVILTAVFLSVIIIRFRFYFLSRAGTQARKRTIYLWRHIVFRLRFKGYKKARRQTEYEWILTLPHNELLTKLYDNVSCAKYAPSYTDNNYALFFEDYKRFSAAYKNITRYKIKTLIFALFLTLFLTHDSTRAQEEQKNAEDIYKAAEKAVREEYWEQAVTLFNEGKKNYPEDWRFPEELGDLYSSKGLHRLAKNEYLIAYNIIPDDLYLIYSLAMTCASLNENSEAALYFENYLAINPDNTDVISSLGWLYLKLHRLKEGESLLLSAIENHGADKRLSMTLAIIYSDMLNYEEAEHWYNVSIDTSLKTGTFESLIFASTAYYNYAILESRFYNYNNAYINAQKSLDMANRDTGHMIHGELYLRRLDFSNSFSEYTKAFDMDKHSPLPKVSLAQIYLITGKLEHARLYAEDCLKATNHEWMFRFGMDLDQYARDLHEILYKAYLGLYNCEKFKLSGTIKERWSNFIKKSTYLFRYTIHKKLYEKHSLITAHSYNINEMGGQFVDALIQYYNSFSSYKDRASFYLKLAADYETKLIEKSMPSYLYEEGKLKENAAFLEDAIKNLDAVWERDTIANSLASLYHSAKNKKQKERSWAAAESLYLMNSGALLQNLIRLPVELNVTGGSNSQNRKTMKALSKTGFMPVSARSRYSCRFSLDITIADGAAQGIVLDRISGKSITRTTIPLNDFSRAALSEFANKFSAAVFNVK